jgi:hypothetical protein
VCCWIGTGIRELHLCAHGECKLQLGTSFPSFLVMNFDFLVSVTRNVERKAPDLC